MTRLPIEMNPDFTDWPALRALLNDAFAAMEGRIDPPSSLAQMDARHLQDMARVQDLFLGRIGGRPVACLYGIADGAAYHVSKLAVSDAQRGQGLARRLLDAAAARAQALGLQRIELQTRVELVENHAIFRRLGFVQTGTSAHEGFDRPTSLTFARAVAAG